MQSQQFQNSNLYNMYPSDEDNLFGDDNVLFRNISDPYPMDNSQNLNLMLPSMDYQPQEQDNNLLPLVAPLVNPLGNDLVDAVSRMNVGGNQIPAQNNQRQSLSLEIKPCISVTEPTPVQRMPTLRFVDDFIAQHESQLDSLPEQQQDISMDPNFILNDLLLTQPGNTDWLSWTPMGGNSPASVVSTSFDEQSFSPEPSASIYLNMMSASAEDLLGSSSLSWGYPSPSLSDYSDSGNYNNDNNNNNLTVKKDRRARRVSEPPMVSPSLQEQFFAEQPNQLQTQDRAIRRSKSDTRRGRSNSSASSTGNHVCPHPGCGKSFTRPYNLTSHMRTHTADRPFACSQCGRRFARQHDRNRHEKLHWGVKPYACNFCNKPFARMDALNRHLRVENGCQQRQQQQQQQITQQA